MSSDQHIFMAHGHTGRIMKLDLQGKVLGASGGQGKAPHRYGEAHFIALDAREDIYVADTLNWRVQKSSRRQAQKSSDSPDETHDTKSY